MDFVSWRVLVAKPEGKFKAKQNNINIKQYLTGHTSQKPLKRRNPYNTGSGCGRGGGSGVRGGWAWGGRAGWWVGGRENFNKQRA